ncbi:hypothetical protein H632_c1123p0, partial [Helicosporidium sp. ATCC 50920]
ASASLFKVAETGEGGLEAVQELLEAGADPGHADREGVTCLMHAASRGDLEVMQALLQAGAPWHDLDCEGNSAGEYASGMGHTGAVQLLLEWAVQAELILGALERSRKRRSAGGEQEGVGGAGERVEEGIEAASRDKPIDFETASNADYLASKVEYSQDTLVDAEGEAVMMEWERPLMERHAAMLCAAGGDVMNVGFGMGIVDGCIASHAPRSHTIVEAHPGVLARMRAEGWYDRPGVRVVEGRWQDVLRQLDSYDGIFFDTYGEDGEDLREFHRHLPALLKPKGIYSFFNGLCPDNMFFNVVQGEIIKRELHTMDIETSYEPIKMNPLPESIWKGIKHRYWHLPAYMLPRCVKQ